MPPIRLHSGELASVLPPGGLTLISSCSAESALLADEIANAGPALGAMTFTGIFVPGLNRRTYLANPDCRVLSFFMTPELRERPDAVEFLPLCYDDVARELRRRRPQAALFMCAPPGEDGHCSLGTQVDFLPDLWRDIPIRIAHINSAMPATRGDRGIPFDCLTAYYEEVAPLLAQPDTDADAVVLAVAGHIAPHIPDGSTLQLGLGKIPGAVLRCLAHRRGLRLHTGLIGDAVVDLIEAGALAAEPPSIVGAAIGSKRLYDALATAPFLFRPVSVTHDLVTLGGIEKLVTINSALEVDLLGQAFAELPPGGWMSGPGGASDFARGARLAGGLRIVALAADGRRGAVSRIVAPGAGRGPVSLGRMDIDLVVTEHGVADLRARDYDARARALIAIAAPQFRDVLEQQWRGFAIGS
jgi:acyl-CoA hydrolase